MSETRPFVFLSPDPLSENSVNTSTGLQRAKHGKLLHLSKEDESLPGVVSMIANGRLGNKLKNRLELVESKEEAPIVGDAPFHEDAAAESMTKAQLVQYIEKELDLDLSGRETKKALLERIRKGE